MITLEFSAALVLYISLSVLSVLIYWVFFGKEGDKRVNFSMPDRYIWQCSICTFLYVDSKHPSVSVCPRCGSYNSKEHETIATTRMNTA